MEGLVGCALSHCQRLGFGESGWRFREFGWGGRIRTFTILINSEVSYRLDHAPAASSAATQSTNLKGRARSIELRRVRCDEGSL
jgi:hypothetical protein